MNTSVRARQDARGFSFIELLVTIIIAGIAFAALVPVFVTASQKGAGDSARNVALNLAQDRIEKIRELDYDQITETNLTDATFAGGGFGTSIDVPNGGGSKAYRVDYSVTYVGGTKDGVHVATATSGDGSEQYKLVSVDVYWTGNPQPVKHAVLKTIVYKQYAGSNLDSLSVGPLTRLGLPLHDFIRSYTIDLTAEVNAADIAYTNSVVFRVYGADGNQLKRLVRYAKDTTTAGVFTQTYTVVGTNGLIAALGSRDGTYTFKAIALNKNGYEGNTQTVTLPVETGPPPPPTGLVAVASNLAVDLAWDKSPAGDVTSYQVYRSEVSGSYGTTFQTVTVVLGQVPAFRDTAGLVNTHTYFYRVVAVDGLGNASLLPSSEVSAKPIAPTDGTPPGNVTNFSVTSTGTQAPPLMLSLTWKAATDNIGVAKYHVYRKLSSDTNFASTPTFTILATDIAYMDRPSSGYYTFVDSSGLGPLTQYGYKIVAVDAAGNISAAPALVPFATTLDYQYCSVTVKNGSPSKTANLEMATPDGILVLQTGQWPGISNPPNPSSAVPRNGSKTWQLPVGFSFKAGWELSDTSSYTYKPVPSSGVILNTNPLTVSFP